jgi:hypothetical protein
VTGSGGGGPGDERRGVDGVLQANGLAVAPGAAPAAAGEAYAELAATQVVAAEVAAGAARCLVVGVLHEGVTPAPAGGGVGGDPQGADGADELAGVAELLLGGVEGDVADENDAAAAAVGGGGRQGRGRGHGAVHAWIDRKTRQWMVRAGKRGARTLGYKAGNST